MNVLEDESSEIGSSRLFFIHIIRSFHGISCFAAWVGHIFSSRTRSDPIFGRVGTFPGCGHPNHLPRGRRFRVKARSNDSEELEKDDGHSSFLARVWNFHRKPGVYHDHLLLAGFSLRAISAESTGGILVRGRDYHSDLLRPFHDPLQASASPGALWLLMILLRKNF